VRSGRHVRLQIRVLLPTGIPAVHYNRARPPARPTAGKSEGAGARKRANANADGFCPRFAPVRSAPLAFPLHTRLGDPACRCLLRTGIQLTFYGSLWPMRFSLQPQSACMRQVMAPRRGWGEMQEARALPHAAGTASTYSSSRLVYYCLQQINMFAHRGSLGRPWIMARARRWRNVPPSTFSL
jgi:hypothetical protein